MANNSSSRKYKPGDKVGKWTILSYDEVQEKYLCRCQCGTEGLRLTGTLSAGFRFAGDNTGCRSCRRTLAVGVVRPDGASPQALISRYPQPRTATKGAVVKCLYRNADCQVTSWTKAPLSWPRVQPLGQLGGSGLWVNDTLVRAIRTESAEALKWWFGVSAGVVWKWRKAFGVSGTATTLGSKRAHQHHSKSGAKAMKRRKWTEGEREEKRRISSELGLKPGIRWTPERGGWTPEQFALLGTDNDQGEPQGMGREPDARGRSGAGRIDVRVRDVPPTGTLDCGSRQPDAAGSASLVFALGRCPRLGSPFGASRRRCIGCLP